MSGAIAGTSIVSDAFMEDLLSSYAARYLIRFRGALVSSGADRE
jgi:hypothetical protein